jgi:hypothetical protein
MDWPEGGPKEVDPPGPVIVEYLLTDNPGSAGMFMAAEE